MFISQGFQNKSPSAFKVTNVIVKNADLVKVIVDLWNIFKTRNPEEVISFQEISIGINIFLPCVVEHGLFKSVNRSFNRQAVPVGKVDRLLVIAKTLCIISPVHGKIIGVEIVNPAFERLVVKVTCHRKQ